MGRRAALSAGPRNSGRSSDVTLFRSAPEPEFGSTVDRFRPCMIDVRAWSPSIPTILAKPSISRWLASKVSLLLTMHSPNPITVTEMEKAALTPAMQALLRSRLLPVCSGRTQLQHQTEGKQQLGGPM